MKTALITFLSILTFQTVSFSQEQTLIPYRKSNLWGLADENKKIVVPPQFEETRFSSEGLAPAKKNGKWGYVDAKANVKIKFGYESAGEFINGRALIRLKNQAVGCYINKSGKITEWIKGIPDDLTLDKEYLEQEARLLENKLKENYDIIIPIENAYIAKKRKKKPVPQTLANDTTYSLTDINSFLPDYEEIKVFRMSHQYLFTRKADSTIIYDKLSKDSLITNIPYENITNACSSFFMYKENGKIGLKSIKNEVIEDLLPPLYCTISIPVLNTATKPYPCMISSIFLLEGQDKAKGIYIYNKYTIAPKYMAIDQQPVTTSKHLYFYAYTKEGKVGYVTEEGMEFFE